jgi:hypothetical protein
MNRRECYQILELSESASMEDVRKAYLKLSKKYHPDINPSGKQRFQKINEAYNCIRSNKFESFDGSQDKADSPHDNMYNFNNFSDFNDILKQIILMFQQGKMKNNAGFIGMIVLRVVFTFISLFIFFRPLFSFGFFVIGSIYDIFKELFMILLYGLTVIIMNIIDLCINLSIVFYSITVKPVFIVSDLFLSLVYEYIRELKWIIVSSALIFVLLKLIESLRSNYKSDKIWPFIFSIIILWLVFICEVYI